MFRYRLIPVCILLPVCLANCLWDTATEPGEPLNLEETEALYLGMQGLVRDTAPEFVSMTPDGGVFACPGGGQVQIASEGGEPATADGMCGLAVEFEANRYTVLSSGTPR
ncbi:MAG: hypothetical protein OXU74_04095 [Gemmatimonadota bacterium]|nr:hypothetical protein [Gemmatimonadota bacterium]